MVMIFEVLHYSCRGTGLFLFVPDNILKSDAMLIEETVNFFYSSKGDHLTFTHYSGLWMHSSMHQYNIVITCLSHAKIDKSVEIWQVLSTGSR